MLELLLATLSASPFQSQELPPLLPETPPDWRYERIEFPLSFAPELDYSGFEELRFAPGMFSPGDETYFTYALGMRLDGDIPLDAPSLAALFETYFRGLIGSVGASRELDLDLEQISATARGMADDAARFEVIVDAFDAFSTGQALRLVLELHVHYQPHVTELFGLVSPQPTDAPLWSKLRPQAEAWRAARPAPVFLNHVYVIPDAETYAALAANDYLRQSFAVSETRETVRADMSYTGLYFYGQRTYFEFLPPSKDTFPEGSSGVALGLEQAGATNAMKRRLAEHNLQAFGAPVTRALEGQHVPWFEMLGVERASPTSRLDLFTMEYSARFLSSWHERLDPRVDGIGRSSVLTRYAAQLGQAERRAAAPFQDITEVHLALDADELERWLTVCDTLGYAMDEDEETWTVQGPQFRFLLQPSDEPGGVVGLRLSLRQPLERAPMQLGDAQLRFEGTHAFFDFQP